MERANFRDRLERLRLVDSYGISVFGMCLIGLVFVALSVLAMHLAWEHDRKACEAAGGQLVSDVSTGVGTGFDSKGNVVSGSVTTVDVDCVAP